MSRSSSVPFVWRRALRESDLAATAKLVRFVIETYMDKDGLAYPSTATVAAGASLSERAVEKWRKFLEEAGWLVGEDDRRGGRSETVKYLAAMPETANDVRRSEFERANALRQKGESNAAKGERRSPEEVKDEKARRAAWNGRAAPLGECEGCGETRALVDSGAHFCTDCATAREAA